jgi:hypothetical protein
MKNFKKQKQEKKSKPIQIRFREKNEKDMLLEAKIKEWRKENNNGNISGLTRKLLCEYFGIK